MIKIIGGISAALIGIGAIIFIKKKNKGDSVKRDPQISKKIKEAAIRKVLKILSFVSTHSEQIEAASTLIGFVSGAISISAAIKEFKRGDESKKRLDEIKKTQNKLGNYVNNCFDVINRNLYIINMNLRTVDGDLIKVADKLDIQILKEGEVL